MFSLVVLSSCSALVDWLDDGYSFLHVSRSAANLVIYVYNYHCGWEWDRKEM